MKLYLTPDNGFFHQCISPLFRCVYKLQEDGYYKCPVCIFKFPGILTLGSEHSNVLRYDGRLLVNSNYKQLGRIPSVTEADIGRNKSHIEVLDL